MAIIMETSILLCQIMGRFYRVYMTHQKLKYELKLHEQKEGRNKRKEPAPKIQSQSCNAIKREKVR